jgi:hypothetical protein
LNRAELKEINFDKNNQIIFGLAYPINPSAIGMPSAYKIKLP